MPNPDLVLLHAPAQMDFRERDYRHWMMCNTVATSQIFEYYPIGFIILMEYLEKRGFEVRIINMAVKMSKNRRFDPAAQIAKLRPRAFGIDIHWAPHSAGALELAALCKKIHPDIPVILGGYTASVFHEEAIRDPNVDFVMRGDSTEEPMVELMCCLKEGRAPMNVPNLTWKENGEVRVNPLSYQPEELNIKVDFGLLKRHMLRYLDFRGNLFTGYDWPAYSFNMSLWCRGCKYRCVTCGGNNWALGRKQLATRNLEEVADEVAGMLAATPHHVSVPGDPRMGDWRTFFAALKRKNLPRAPGLELFTTGDEEFLDSLFNLGPKAEVALTPESHDEDIRRAYGRPFSNADMEHNISYFLGLGGKVRLFFMVGLPGQTVESVRQTVKYSEQLFDRYAAFPKQFDLTISVLTPFIDPGSMAFRNPEAHGYRLFTRTLADHANAMRQLHWKDVLGYETEHMTRAEIVDIGLEASERICHMRQLFGSLKPKHAEDYMRDLNSCQVPGAAKGEGKAGA